MTNEMSSSTERAIPVGTNTSGAARVALAAVLGVWFLVVVLANAANWFVPPRDQPPLALLAAVVVPLALFALVYALSGRFRGYVRAGDPVLLTYLQSWRILGAVFLVLMSFGLLPAAFALGAGWGDVFIGLTAPFIAGALAARGAHRAGWWFIGWQLLGILDLVSAMGTGATLRLTGAAGAEQMIALNQLPLGLVPTFAVPLFLILHIATIVQVRAAAVRDSGSQPEPARALLGGVN
jgi:hypothetical protein